jgi:hypothetical protein
MVGYQSGSIYVIPKEPKRQRDLACSTNTLGLRVEVESRFFKSPHIPYGDL